MSGLGFAGEGFDERKGNWAWADTDEFETISQNLGHPCLVKRKLEMAMPADREFG